VPLVIWAPGRAPEAVERMTSHLDVPATVMNLLGVTNSPEDYSLGFDLFGPQKREYCVLAGWGNVAYVDSEFKLKFYSDKFAVLVRQGVTTIRRRRGTTRRVPCHRAYSRNAAGRAMPREWKADRAAPRTGVRSQARFSSSRTSISCTASMSRRRSNHSASTP